jgi:hypothetical protein
MFGKIVYYQTKLEEVIKSKNINPRDCTQQIYREHFMQSMQSVIFTKSLENIDENSLIEKRIYLPPKAPSN